MITAAAAVVCALSLLGKSPEKFFPVIVLDAPPRGASPHVEGFVQRDPDTIYLIASTAAVQDVQRTECRRIGPLRKLASVLVHEEWHLRHGADERAAYQAQLTALLALGEEPGRPLYDGVRRAMLSVVGDRRGDPRLMASTAR